MDEPEISSIAQKFGSMTEQARSEFVSKVLSNSSNPSGFNLTYLAMQLRDLGHLQWSEAIFMLAAAFSHQKNTAELQLAIQWSLTGKLELALALLKEIIRETGLPPVEKIYAARLFARSNEFSAARRLLDEAFGYSPERYHDILSEYQFIDFMEEFQFQKALSLDQDITKAYAVASYADVIREIELALKERRPYSLIRLGDGEGINIRLSVSDESKFSLLYTQGRKQIHEIWYSASTLMDNNQFIDQMFRVQKAYNRANTVSILHELGLHHEYKLGSPRGVPALVNIYRYFLDLPHGCERPRSVCGANIHRIMLLHGDLSRILKGRSFVGLVSCYDKLPGLLSRKYRIEESTLAQTCGEYASRKYVLDGGDDVGLEDYFLTSHFNVCKQLESIRAGELYLVAAGIFGKIYCDLIKSGGGIALDIGSVADIWMGVSTRGFTSEEKAFCLVD